MKLGTRQNAVNEGQSLAEGKLTVPYGHVAMLVRFAEARSLSLRTPMVKLGFHPEQLNSSQARVADRQYSNLLLEVEKLCSDTSFWFEFGSQFTFAAIGELGQLLVTSRNGRDAIPLFCRYYGVISCGTILECNIDDDASIYLVKSCPSHSLESRIKTELLASAIRRNTGFLLNVDHPVVRYEFDYEEPAHVKDYHHYLGAEVSFGHERARIVFRKEDIDKPFALSDEVIKNLAIQNCQSMLKRLDVQASLVQRVRAVVLMTPGLEPSREQVAFSLGMSGRTLTRKLSEQGARYDEIRREIQYERARDLLSATSLSINEIAPLVGFDNGSNFSRAFVKWNGRTPSEFRKNEQ